MNARRSRALLLLTAGAITVAPAVLVAPAGAQTAQVSTEVVDRLQALQGSGLGPPGGEVRALALSVSDPDRLYLGTATGHLYASEDGGSHWNELPIRLSHEAVVDNILIHPGNADLVYAAYWSPTGTGGLVRTADGGRTWEELDLGGHPSLRAIAVAPSDVRVLYVGGIGGVWRSADGGDTWMNVNGSGLATEFVESLAVDPRDPDHVYAGTWRQVYRTRNGGGTWQRIYQGMALDRDVFSLAISPHDPDTLFAGTCNFLYRSSNSGGSWAERRSGLATAHNRIHTIVYDPEAPEVMYAGTRGALYRSLDGGRDWNVLVGGVSVSSLALDAHRGRLFVGTEERGVLVGPAAGPFVESNTGLTSASVVAFDALPGAPRVLFAARADGPTETSIHYSTDVGRTWRELGSVPGAGAVRWIRAQASPVNRVLVAGDEGWWSVRPGGNWAPVPAPPGTLSGLEIAHQAGGVILAATSEGLFAADPVQLDDTEGESRPFGADEDGVWRAVWTDGPLRALAVADVRYLAVGEDRVLTGSAADILSGGAPTSLRQSDFTEPVIDVALVADDPDVAYAVTRHDVFRSADAGASWRQLPLPWPAAELRAVAVDPSQPDQVLALDYKGAVYRGHGQGQHWLVLDDDPGLYRAWALRLSPQAPGYALVATQGHGLRVVSLRPLAPVLAGGQS